MAKIQRSYWLDPETAKWVKMTAAEKGASSSQIIEIAIAFIRSLSGDWYEYSPKPKEQKEE